MGVNEFTDLADDEFMDKYSNSLIVPKRIAYKEKDLNKTASSRKLSNLPESVNWYQDGYVSRPLDQQGCGACWAFSTAAAVESLALISGYDKQLTELSI